MYVLFCYCYRPLEDFALVTINHEGIVWSSTTIWCGLCMCYFDTSRNYKMTFLVFLMTKVNWVLELMELLTR